MQNIHKLIAKYGIILALSSLLGYSWFYLQVYFIQHTNPANYDLWQLLPTYSGYLFNVLICILLLIDIRKSQLNYYLIAFTGLFYPLVGISAFLILYIFKTTNDLNNSKSNKI